MSLCLLTEDEMLVNKLDPSLNLDQALALAVRDSEGLRIRREGDSLPFWLFDSCQLIKSRAVLPAQPNCRACSASKQFGDWPGCHSER